MIFNKNFLKKNKLLKKLFKNLEKNNKLFKNYNKIWESK